jgi:pumilio RNA-binding family
MVVLEGTQMASALGQQYAQGAPALKLVQKRFIGLHQWLSPVYSKDIKESLVSVTVHIQIIHIYIFLRSNETTILLSFRNIFFFVFNSTLYISIIL